MGSFSGMFSSNNEKYMLYLRDEYYKEVSDYYKLEIVIPTIGDIKKDKNGYIPPATEAKNNKLVIHFVANEIPDIYSEQGQKFLKDTA